MEHVFHDLKKAPLWAWAMLVAGAILLAAVVFNGSMSSVARGFCVIGAWVCLCIFLWPPLLKAAHEDHRHLLTVCIWSSIAMLTGIACVVYGFYSITGTNYTKYDKLLNIVPVVVAIWAAALGWLIHFKLTTKAHRTNNAFSIIMETRKSAEFLKKQELVTRHFPPGTDSIPTEYEAFFPASSLRQLLATEGADKTNIERAEAVLALKYILNYYEFMAVGIRAGDLDEMLIYDTIHPSVCATFKRASSLVAFLSDPTKPGGDATTYCELKFLVGKWAKMRLTRDAAAS